MEEDSENDSYSTFIEKLVTPTYEDVTVLINSHMPIIIDGDALMVTALTQENYKLNLGGQYLHIIYYCERVLDIIKQRGGNVIIVFFSIWDIIWGKNYCLKTCRSVLYNHFKHNTTLKVFTCDLFYSVSFSDLVDTVKPRCVLLNLSMNVDVRTLYTHFKVYSSDSLISNEQFDELDKIFAGEISFFCGNDLPCIDIGGMVVHTSTIHSFYIGSLKIVDSLDVTLNKIIVRDYTKTFPVQNPVVSLNQNYDGYDARRAVVVIATSIFLKNLENSHTAKLFLLCYSAVEVLSITNRSCSLKKNKHHLLHSCILKWHEELYNALLGLTQSNTKLDWSTIADLWQGTLFGYICHIVTNDISNGEQLGLFKDSYENLVDLVNKESKQSIISPYPIKPVFIDACEIKIVDNKLPEQVALVPIESPLIMSFCGHIFTDVHWANPRKFLLSHEFNELHHWHSRKPMTDEFDHIHDTIPKRPTTEREKYYYMKAISQQARYMNLYGRSLEGNRTNEVIICQAEDSKKKGTSKIKKQSKGAQKIIMQNKTEKNKEKFTKEMDLLNRFKLDLKKHENLTNLRHQLEEINLISEKLTFDESKLTGRLLKLKVLSYIAKAQFAAKSDVDMSYIKDIFVIIRDISNKENEAILQDKDKILISTLLHQFGFGEIAKLNNYPMDVKYTQMKELDSIRYQLEHLGPELERKSDGVYDEDIGYAPDPWQTEFIEAIRKNESALVVAPTSSGKTFASYYCMKRVLQQSPDGVVVYVSPTKALVNQVAATIYHRFSNVKLRDGVSVVGIFTRDYKTNPTNCRVLVTVPQCLDIFLLSPRQYTWLSKVKYVVFDEVHRLSGHEEGLVWERCMLLIRCPFLALSATVDEPSNFHKWLQHIENFKKEQDIQNNCVRENASYKVKLVIHTERHSDLIKYTYGKNGIEHYHPYCSLTEVVLNMHNGIPSTISLSPFETLKLFEAMYASDNSHEFLPADLHPDVYFKQNCNKGFLNRNFVRDYESLLSKTFYKAFTNHKAAYSKILRTLAPKSNKSLDNDYNVINLLSQMYERNMLPTIVFTYNRTLIEFMHSTLTGHCEATMEEIDRRTEKKNLKLEKLMKKQREREEAKNKTDKESVVESPLNILRETGSKFKGVGLLDSSDVNFIETNRLRGLSQSHPIIMGFQHGIAYHHAGLNNKLRSSVEMLFRLGIVKVVFATGTLALGIHMPCKSVVICGDSPYLNSLEFHQMSGRAGRRGYDIEGNVIFAYLSKKRQDMLMTDKLPKLLGNFPISVTLVLQLLLLVNKVTEKNRESEYVTRVTNARALALLDNSLLFQTRPLLKEQIKHFVGFSTQLLLIQEVIGTNGSPLKISGLITHLHYHQPANLAFAYLLRSGVFRNLIKKFKNANDIHWALIVVVSHLFTNLKLHPTQLCRDYNNSIVVLEPLPKIVSQSLEEYNKEVTFVFEEYFLSISRYLAASLGVDNTLPLSKVKFNPLYEYEKELESEGTLSYKIKKLCLPRQTCSAFVALSGFGDKDLYIEHLVSNIRHEICPDIKVIPYFKIDKMLNSYAADFYRHGIKNAIITDNGLKGGEEFSRLKDFLLVLKTIVTGLEELEPVDDIDPILVHFTAIANKFDQLFQAAFPRFTF